MDIKRPHISLKFIIHHSWVGCHNHNHLIWESGAGVDDHNQSIYMKNFIVMVLRWLILIGWVVGGGGGSFNWSMQ